MHVVELLLVGEVPGRGGDLTVEVDACIACIGAQAVREDIFRSFRLRVAFSDFGQGAARTLARSRCARGGSWRELCGVRRDDLLGAFTLGNALLSNAHDPDLLRTGTTANQ